MKPKLDKARRAWLAWIMLCACGPQQYAKSWPEVVDHHWFATGLLISWLALCLVWLVRGFKVTVKQAEKEGAK
jgi:hypothetical protein